MKHARNFKSRRPVGTGNVAKILSFKKFNNVKEIKIGFTRKKIKKGLIALISHVFQDRKVFKLNHYVEWHVHVSRCDEKIVACVTK